MGAQMDLAVDKALSWEDGMRGDGEHPELKLHSIPRPLGDLYLFTPLFSLL